MICPNCGGDYANWAQRCPYCGSVNEAADERVYLSHLEEIRRRLDRVDEESEQDYRREIGNTGIKFFLLGLAILVMASAVAIVWILVSKISDRAYEKRANETMTWEKEEFAMLDELYEKGDFDAILEENNRLLTTRHSIYSWAHYYLVGDYYAAYRDCNALVEALKNGQKVMTSDLSNALYGGLVLRYDGREERIKQLRTSYDANGGGYGLSEADAELVREYRSKADEMFAALGWTDAQVQELYEKCKDKKSDYIRSAPCFEAAKEINK